MFTRYTCSEQIFRGKFGGFTVAAKHVFASDTSTADFTREAVIMANLAHPSIVAFYGIAKAPTGGLLASNIIVYLFLSPANPNAYSQGKCS